VLGVLEGDRSGELQLVVQRDLGEWQVPTDRAINGSRVLTITVSPD
jgi:hypothetical protein